MLLFQKVAHKPFTDFKGDVILLNFNRFIYQAKKKLEARVRVENLINIISIFEIIYNSVSLFFK